MTFHNYLEHSYFSYHIPMFGSSKKQEKKYTFDLDVRMHGSVTVGTKGQIVIPKEVRDMLDLNEGDSLLTITKYRKFVGFIRTDDVTEFIELLKAEAHMND